MEWTQGTQDMDVQAAAADDPMLGAGPARRSGGRKISHRKNPSDTFAFAAGQLFQHTPEDFYNLLETPIDFAGDAGTARSSSVFRPTAPSLVGLDAAAINSRQQHSAPGTAGYQQQQLELKSASYDNLHAQAGATSNLTTPSGSGFLEAPAAAAAAAPDAGASNPAAAAALQPAQAGNSPAAAAAAAPSAAQAPFGPEVDPQEDHMQEEEDEDEDEDQQQQRHHRSASGGSGSGGGAGSQTRTNALDTSQLDPRRAKRILANRQSAQRSRMKRLQYIHDLENRSATAVAKMKELQAEVDEMTRQQEELTSAVESQKAQVSTLSQQLLHEQAMQVALINAISTLRSQAPWLAQQQQQQHAHAHQQQPGAGYPAQGQQVQQQQQQYQQRLQQQVHVKPEPVHHDSAAPYYQLQHQHHQQQQWQSRPGPAEPCPQYAYQQPYPYILPPQQPYKQPQPPQGYHPATFPPSGVGPGAAAAAAAAPLAAAGAQGMHSIPTHPGRSPGDSIAAGAADPAALAAVGAAGVAGPAAAMQYDLQLQAMQQQQMQQQQQQRGPGRVSPDDSSSAMAQQQQQQVQVGMPLAPQNPAGPTGSTLGSTRHGSTSSLAAQGSEMPGIEVMELSKSSSGNSINRLQPPPLQQQQQQQPSGNGGTGAAGDAGGTPLLNRSPSPSKALGLVDFGGSGSLGLASMGLGGSPSMGLGGSPGMPDLEGDLDGMLTDNPFLGPGLSLGASGECQVGRLESLVLKQEDVCGVQAAAGVDLRKTSSM